MISKFEFSEQVVGILVDSDIDTKTLDEIHEEILNKLDSHPTINLFVKITEGHSISLINILKDLIFKLDHAKHFSKIAMVSDLKRMSSAMIFKDLVMKADVRAFENQERMEAMNWISE
ncbi:SpoIIAA-like [Gillisia sp. Hel1_33_143]|uniref:STAS/SEC14 domain-containing protein n=1 Tax=Gillisia sp. Hel1_33_143 TaxID=1336796 RepID=UPI00087C95A0|nr:STAS/SEC14 domain-containing protein [Gillisia sp. Hel1_33_143]SDR70350.1 SpoIIAA-like [Gillisia sp. Hel1_33_143]